MSGVLVLAAAFGGIIACGSLAVLINDALEAHLRGEASPAGGGERKRPAPHGYAPPARPPGGAVVRALPARSWRSGSARPGGRGGAVARHGKR